MMTSGIGVFALIFFPIFLFGQPKIISFSPLSAPVGSTVIINGQNFGATPLDNIVHFGPVRAKVISASINQLIVEVPNAAAYSLITVTTESLIAQSSYPFSLSFPDGDTAFVSTSFKKIPLGVNGAYSILPAGVTLADLNDDGKADLILGAESSGGWISIIPNTSTGGTISFGSEVRPDANYANDRILAADFDGDGKKDLVGAEPNRDFAIVLRNKSTGNQISFDIAQQFNTSVDPYGLAASDIDGDGKLDIISANSGYSVVGILKNTSSIGAISFTPIEINVGCNSTNIVVRDFDGDNKPDIAVSCVENNKIVVLRNQSTNNVISFSAPVSLPVGSYIWSMDAGDLDGDGKLDIVASNFNGGDYNKGKISVFMNNSSSGNISFGQETKLNARDASRDVRIADLDGDTKPEVVCVDARGSLLLVYKNKSERGQLNLEGYREFKTGDSRFNYGLAIGDLNGDSRPEMITGYDVSGIDDGLSIFKNLICEPVVSNATPLISFTDSLVTIQGRNLSNVSEVKFGGTPAKSFNIVSREKITAIVGDGSSGQISASNQYGITSNIDFLFSPPPVFSYLSHLQAGKGTAVTINGNYFNGVLSVKFGGVPADTFIVNSPTQIVATVGNGASGPVSVTTVTGTGSYPYFVFAALPEILSYQPQSAGTGDTIIISGKNLNFVSTVTIGTLNAKSFGIYGDSVIKAVVGGISSGNIIVNGPGGADTATGFLHKGPIISSYSSPSGCIESGIEIFIKGKNFTNTTSVLLGEVPANSYTIVSDSLISSIPGLIQSGNIKITTPSGIATWVLAGPKLQSVSPNIGKEGDTLFIKGKFLCSIKSVMFNQTQSKSFRILSDSLLETIVPAEGSGILVMGTNGSQAIAFTHLAPRIFNMSPATGGTGTVVTVTGTNFTNANAVKIGAVPVKSFTVDSDTKITAVIASGPSDTLRITSVNGTGTGRYFVNTDPKITSINPVAGKLGDTILIIGTNLLGVQSILFGGKSAASITILSSNTIRAILADGDSGPVSLTFPGGSASFSDFEFTKSFELCPDATVSISSGKSGSLYQWQINKGNGFELLADTGLYNGTSASTLNLSGVPSTFYGYKYRCKVDNQYSNAYELKFKNDWVGTASSSWEDPNNWGCGLLPDANTDVIINSGNVVINSNVICRSLTVASGVTVTVNSGFTITITH